MTDKPRIGNPEHPRFRAWLVEKLARSSWPRVQNEPLEALAKRLGVQPDVITDAQALLALEAKGRVAPALWPEGDRSKALRVLFEIGCPPPIWSDWQAYCRLRQLTSSSVLRSLVHTLLSGPDQPTWVGRGWRYRGQVLAAVGYGLKTREHKYPYIIKTHVTQGAMRALRTRARALGTNPTALARGMAIDLLEGRLRRLIVVTSATSMWDDESRYWRLEAT